MPLNDELRLSPQDLEERITDKTKLIIINSPSNPTGAVQTEDEMKAIAEMADDKDIGVISDEVYEHFIYEGKNVSPGKYSENVITVNAVSKTYAMTGWRVGYMVAKGCALEELLKIHQYAQACACSISQKAALAAITGPQECVYQMRDEFRRRRDLLVEGFREMGIDLVEPKGAFYLFPRVGDGDSVAARLGKAGVIVVPGSAFRTMRQGAYQDLLCGLKGKPGRSAEADERYPLNRRAAIVARSDEMKEQVEVRELKEGRYVIIDDEPCIIKGISHSKPGKHGSAKARVDAIGIFDNQKRSIVFPVTTKIYVPTVERKTGQVLSIGDSICAAHGHEHLPDSGRPHNCGPEAQDRGRQRGSIPVRHGQNEAGPSLGSHVQEVRLCRRFLRNRRCRFCGNRAAF